MPRQRLAKPWLHAASGYFCTSVNGRRVYLDKDYQVACRKLRELRAEEKRGNQGARDWLDAPFSELSDLYLDDLKARKKTPTYQSYRYRLLRALKILGTTIRVSEVRKFHLAQIAQAMTSSKSPTTVKDTIAAVQTVMSWAVRHDLLQENCLAGYIKPKARMRTRVIEPEEFRALLKHTDPAFRRFLIALRLTGCRPKEVRKLIWECVDLANGLWILPVHKTIDKQREPKPRIIPLPEPIWALCRWLARRPHSAQDYVFLNCRSRRYRKNVLCRKMARLRISAGIGTKAGERLVLYSARHSFGTETTGRITDIELAELMGHTDTRTSRRYVHFNVDRLRDIQRRARRPR